MLVLIKYYMCFETVFSSGQENALLFTQDFHENSLSHERTRL